MGTLRPKYLRYGYMEPLGFGLVNNPTETPGDLGFNGLISHVGVSENRDPNIVKLNSRINIKRTPNFRFLGFWVQALK